MTIIPPDPSPGTTDPRNLPDGLSRDLADLLTRHGIVPADTGTSPDRAIGWAFTELRSFVAAYRTAPAAAQGGDQ